MARHFYDCRFLADTMLGRLARWLRVMGVDVEASGDDVAQKDLASSRLREHSEKEPSSFVMGVDDVEPIDEGRAAAGVGGGGGGASGARDEAHYASVATAARALRRTVLTRDRKVH